VKMRINKMIEIETSEIPKITFLAMRSNRFAAGLTFKALGMAVVGVVVIEVSYLVEAVSGRRLLIGRIGK
jgi:hypothetical protein